MTQQDYINAIKKQQSLVRKLLSSRKRRSEVIDELTKERYQHLVGRFFRPKGDYFKAASNDMDYYIISTGTVSDYALSDRVTITLNCRYIARMYSGKQIDALHTGMQTFCFKPDDDLYEILAPMLVDKARAIDTIDGYYAEMKKYFLKTGK